MLLLSLIVLVQGIMSQFLFLKVQDLDAVLSVRDFKGRHYTHTSQRNFFERIAKQLIPESKLRQVSFLSIALAQRACFPATAVARMQAAPANPEQAKRGVQGMLCLQIKQARFSPARDGVHVFGWMAWKSEAAALEALLAINARANLLSEKGMVPLLHHAELSSRSMFEGLPVQVTYVCSTQGLPATFILLGLEGHVVHDYASSMLSAAHAHALPATQ